MTDVRGRIGDGVLRYILEEIEMDGEEGEGEERGNESRHEGLSPLHPASQSISLMRINHHSDSFRCGFVMYGDLSVC